MTRYGTTDAGERDRQVTLRPITQSRGGSGFPVETEGDTGDGIVLWACKSDVSGRERFAGGQLSAPYETRWEVPYVEDLDPDLVDVAKAFVLVYQDRLHDIIAASMIGRKEGVELLTLARRG